VFLAVNADQMSDFRNLKWSSRGSSPEANPLLFAFRVCTIKLDEEEAGCQAMQGEYEFVVVPVFRLKHDDFPGAVFRVKLISRVHIADWYESITVHLLCVVALESDC